MGTNTSIVLDGHFQNFVESSVSEGRYDNANEVIRAGLRLLEYEETKIKALKNALVEGIESGIVEDFDAETHLRFLKTEKHKNG